MALILVVLDFTHRLLWGHRAPWFKGLISKFTHKKNTIKTRWWFQICFLFTLTLGKWSNLTIIFFEWVETTNEKNSHSLKKYPPGKPVKQFISMNVILKPAIVAGCFPSMNYQSKIGVFREVLEAQLAIHLPSDLASLISSNWQNSAFFQISLLGKKSTVGYLEDHPRTCSSR